MRNNERQSVQHCPLLLRRPEFIGSHSDTLYEAYHTGSCAIPPRSIQQRVDRGCSTTRRTEQPSHVVARRFGRLDLDSRLQERLRRSQPCLNLFQQCDRLARSQPSRRQTCLSLCRRLVLQGGQHCSLQLRSAPTSNRGLQRVIPGHHPRPPHISRRGQRGPSRRSDRRRPLRRWSQNRATTVVCRMDPQLHLVTGRRDGATVPATTQRKTTVTYSPAVAQTAGLPWYGPNETQFVNYYSKQANAVSPTYHSGEAGAAILILAKAIEKANSLDTTGVRQAILSLDVMTFFGEFRVDSTGKQSGHSMVLVQWQGGALTVVAPGTAASGTVKYPYTGS